MVAAVVEGQGTNTIAPATPRPQREAAALVKRMNMVLVGETTILPLGTGNARPVVVNSCRLVKVEFIKTIKESMQKNRISMHLHMLKILIMNYFMM